jgi:hypothetical protein
LKKVTELQHYAEEKCALGLSLSMQQAADNLKRLECK